MSKIGPLLAEKYSPLLPDGRGLQGIYLTEISEQFGKLLIELSNENIQIIQNGIRAGVFQKSNGQYIIGPQECDSLKVIMRSIFLQHAVNQPKNTSGQIEELNKIVLDYCIHNVYSEAKGYMKYLYDVSTLAVPLPTPIVESQRDKKNYIMPKWF